VVGGVIHVYVEVAGDEEFMRCGCRSGEKRCEFIQKAEQNREFCEDGEVVRWRAIGHREGRCNGRIGRGDHKL